MGDYAKTDPSMSSTVFEGMKKMMEKMQAASSPAAEVVNKLESGGDVMNMLDRPSVSVMKASQESRMQTTKALSSKEGWGGGGGMYKFGKQGIKDDTRNY